MGIWSSHRPAGTSPSLCVSTSQEPFFASCHSQDPASSQPALSCPSSLKRGNCKWSSADGETLKKAGAEGDEVQEGSEEGYRGHKQRRQGGTRAAGRAGKVGWWAVFLAVRQVEGDVLI